ncbi:MAG: ATP-binding protein [Planctomycetes bacterium]|nr:ATP-binding protein [Planctomycetota bacterium]
MLAEFRVSNYRSFKDEQVLSLIATSEESKGANSIKVGGYNILKSAVVYGANASGKSNLIKAMACMSEIVRESAGYKPDQSLPITPFAFDKKTKKQPSTFEVTFFMDAIRYQYGFSATSKKITREWLLSWPKKRAKTWFERDIEQDEPYFGPSLKGQNKVIWETVKDNSLFLSTAAQFNHEQLSKVFKWFEDQFREMPGRKMAVQITDEMLFNYKYFKEGPELYKLVMEIFKNADFGIDDIEIEKVNVDNLNFPKDMPEEIRKSFIRKFSEHPPYKKIFSHCEGKYSLSFEEESDGTQRYYSLLGPLLESIVFGYTIFEDELELYMHPLLTHNLIELVREFQVDANSQVQLIFTTHDTTLLNPELFGRDQVWFTEKDKQGATQLYSLADYKGVRKDEPMQKKYLAGRYGAIPILERFDLVGTKK